MDNAIVVLNDQIEMIERDIMSLKEAGGHEFLIKQKEKIITELTKAIIILSVI